MEIKWIAIAVAVIAVALAASVYFDSSRETAVELACVQKTGNPTCSQGH